jgi:hypothetical protein
MIEWILEKLPVVIFVVIFIAQLVRGFLKTRGAQAEPPPRHDELEQDRRNREIQAEIRRKIAERRGGHVPAPEAPELRPEPTPEPPVVVMRDPTEIPVPEPLRRMLEQLERKVQPAPPPAPPVMAERRALEVHRQEKLAEEMRVLEESRVLVQRRAAAIAKGKRDESQSERGLRTAARGRLLDDLRDADSLRRAFVLREVLGPPVGLK